MNGGIVKVCRIKGTLKDLWSPLILLLTCSLDVMIWSMSVRSLASSGSLCTSQASTRASYWPVVWDSTCLYIASDICRRENSWFGLVWVSHVQHISVAPCALEKELTNIQFLCFCCIFPFRRGPITFLSSGWSVSITRLARICTHTHKIQSYCYQTLLLLESLELVYVKKWTDSHLVIMNPIDWY